MNIQSFRNMHQLVRGRSNLPVFNPADVYSAHVTFIAKLILRNVLILAQLLNTFPEGFKKFLVFGFHGSEFPHRSKSVVTDVLQIEYFIH